MASIDPTSPVPQARSASSEGRWTKLRWAVLLGGVFLVQGLFVMRGSTEIASARVATGWPGIASVANGVTALCCGPLGRVLSLALILAGSWLVTQIAIRLGLGALPALVAGATVAVSPLAASALADPAGRLLALAFLAWLLALRVDPALGASDSLAGGTVPRRALQGALVLVGLWLSQAALLPTFALLGLLGTRGRRSFGLRSRVLLVLVLLVVFVPLAFLRERLPEMGLGYGFATEPSSFSGPEPAAAPVFTTAVLAALCFGAEHPFLLPGRFLPEFALVSGACLLLTLLLVPVAADGERKFQLRLGSSAVVAAALGAMLTAIVGPVAAIPNAILLPASAGVGLCFAALLQPRRTRQGELPASPTAKVCAIAFLVLSATLSVLHHSASTETRMRRAHSADRGQPFAAFALADLGRAVSPEEESAPLADLLAAAPAILLPPEVEIAAGVRGALAHTVAGSPGRALDFTDEWILRSQQRRGRVLAEAVALRLELACRAGNFDQAIDQFLRVRAGDEDPHLSTLAAEALLHVLEDGTLDPTDAEQAILRAEELLAEGEREGGAPSVPALLGLSRLRLGQTRFVEAVRLAEDAARLAPNDAAPRVLLARIYLGLGEREAGLEQVQQAARLDPNDSTVRFMEGRWLCTVPATASSGFQEMLDAWTASGGKAGDVEELTTGLELATKSLTGAGRPEHALRLLDAVAERLPTLAPVQYERARVLRGLRRTDDAEKALERALELDPQHGDARKELAELLGQRGYAKLVRGDRAGAIELFQRVIALDAPGVSTEGMKIVIDGGTNLATAPREIDVEEARRLFDQAIERHRSKDLDGAVESFRASIALLPDNPLAWLNVGEVELERGNYQASEESLRTALKLGAELDSAALDVERAFLLLGRVGLARKDADAVDRVLAEYEEQHPDGAYLPLLQAMQDRLRESGG